MYPKKLAMTLLRDKPSATGDLLLLLKYGVLGYRGSTCKPVQIRNAR
jgi:hypothetical protein